METKTNNVSTATNSATLHLLHIEDNPVDVKLVQSLLEETHTNDWEVVHVDRLEQAKEKLATDNFEVILLDLILPDSEGLDTLIGIREVSLNIPVVIASGLDDENMCIDMLRHGAQDYLVKGNFNGDLLRRTLHHAFERSRLQSQLEEAQRRNKRENEYNTMARFIKSRGTDITAEMYGRMPLCKQAPEQYQELVGLYSQLLDLRIDEQLYKGEKNSSQNLQALAEHLGLLRVGPRDVVDIHTKALEFETVGVSGMREDAYIEEGRLLLLELMGWLASYYRNYAMGDLKSENS